MRDYALATLERALKTAAQAFIALVGSTALITDVDWPVVGSGTAMAFVLSIVTSIGSISLAPGDGPAAFGPESVDPPGEHAAR